MDKNLSPLGYKKITGLSTMKTLAEGGAIPADARFALITAETQAVRWRDDGTNPTTTDGMNLPVLQPYFYRGSLANIKFIEVAASATLHVTFYGQ
jgi:hypothetical protein